MTEGLNAVLGWGLYEAGTPSRQLRAAVVDLVSAASCAADYQTYELPAPPAGTICAGSSSSRDSCPGDSGGPLLGVHISSTGSVLFGAQQGVVSYGVAGCGNSQTPVPGVYTSVFDSLSWIAPHFTVAAGRPLKWDAVCNIPLMLAVSAVITGAALMRLS